MPLSTAALSSMRTSERSTFCKRPDALLRARRTVQRARYPVPSAPTKSASAKPEAAPRVSTVRGFVSRSSAPATSGTLSLLPAALKRGHCPNKARHKASSNVDLPAPVSPVIANKPAPFSGSCSRSISNGAARLARFSPRTARIRITRPPLLRLRDKNSPDVWLPAQCRAPAQKRI